MKKLKIVSIVMAIALAAAAVAGCGSSKPASTSKESSATPEATAAPTESASEVSATSDNESSAASASVASSASAASESSAASASEASAASSASEASSAASAASGELVPSITIEYGDVAAIEALAKDAQNKKIEEGTVVAISGYYSKPVSSMNIMESDDSGKKGIVMIVDGEWEAPAEGTDIDIIGTFVNGQYNSELHVLPENITIK